MGPSSADPARVDRAGLISPVLHHHHPHRWLSSAGFTLWGVISLKFASKSFQCIQKRFLDLLV